MSRQTWLYKQIDLWVEKEIIEPRQANAIAELYPGKQKDRLISILMLLGAILFGAGIILFFAANWQHIPRWGKVSMVTIALILFYASSQFTYQKSPTLSQVLTLLGCIMFGSSIWLIAQVFHISAHYPNGILFWLLGVLPVIFLIKEQLPLGLSALLLGAWIMYEPANTLLIFLVALSVFAFVFYYIYALQSDFALVVALISFILFVSDQIGYIFGTYYHLSYNATPLMWAGLLILGTTFICVSRLEINDARHFSRIYSFIGILLSAVGWLLISNQGIYLALKKLHIYRNALYLYIAIVFVMASVGIYAAVRGKAKISEGWQESYPWIVTYLLILGLITIPISANATLIILSIFMFLWALSLILLGYQTQSNMLFTFGIIAFNVYLLYQYFSLFWRMLPTSLFFIVGGIVLIASGAIMEKQRRKVVQSWQTKEVASNE